MAENLPLYPILVLESDFPERVGKIGLFDIQLPVGNTGLIFVASVPGTLRDWGVDFSTEVEHAARLQAASALVQMGLIRGESFQFVRLALPLTEQQVGDLYGVPSSTVTGWENNTIPIPIGIWRCFTTRLAFVAQISLPPWRAQFQSWRPRVIRVFPNLPIGSNTVNQSNSCMLPSEGCQSVPGMECYVNLKDLE